MSIKSTLFGALFLILALLFSFDYAYRQFTVPWVQFLFQSEFLGLLEESEADQRLLANLDPDQETRYRERFERIRAIRSNLQILELNQKNFQKNLNRAYLIVLALVFSLAIGAYLLHQRYVQRNLATLKNLIERLVEDRATEGQSVRGVFGKMEQMVREAAELMRTKNRKLKTLDHLSNWQESARRHAHEIKTPLTATQLEMERMESLLVPFLDTEARSIWQKGKSHVFKELDRLKEFTVGFSSFGKINQPKLQPINLRDSVADFVEIYAQVSPNLTLEWMEPELVDADWSIQADRDLIRQVWMNLVQNSSQALTAEDKGTAQMTLEASSDGIQLVYSDDGPGIDEAVCERIFEPYVTTKKVGEGMGLGMAISKKIMLDHGGDLEWRPSESGACFVMTFPRPGGVA